MSYKLLVLDIDGTVTNSEKRVLDKTKEAIISLQERGVQVAIASGRSPKGIVSVAKELELDRFGNYVLSFNGAKILNFKTKECVFEKFLPSYIPGRLWNDAIKYKLGILTYSDEILLAGTTPDPYMALESRICNMPVQYRADFSISARIPVNGCLITGNPEDIEFAEPFFAYKYFHETEIFRSEPCFLEVIPKNVDKAYSLKYLLKILGLKREEVV